MPNDLETEIFEAVKEEIERIESERFNSRDPILTIAGKEGTKGIIVKILASERTGAPLKVGAIAFNPAEDLARRNFYSAVRTLNSWQFKKSMDFLSLAATQTMDQAFQQRINLYKQLNKLLKKAISVNPEKAVRTLQPLFTDLCQSIEKYDKLEDAERTYYLKRLDSLLEFTKALDTNNLEAQSHQLSARCSLSLLNGEYLAAYIWLFKLYLLNKESFDVKANGNQKLKEALTNLEQYLAIETGLKEQLEESPTIAKSSDLQTVFLNLLTEIYDVNFQEKTKTSLSFPLYSPSS